MARSLAARIALAFAVLALALLVGIGGALFVGLRSLHTDSQDARLTDIADGLGVQARKLLTSGARPREILDAVRSQLPGGVAITFRTADGRLVSIDDGGPVGSVDVAPGAAAGATSHGSATDAQGRPLRYALVTLRVLGATDTARAIIVSAPDDAADLAARDVVRTLPVVVVVLLLVGIPVGWLLWRSVARPLRTLSVATARVPTGDAVPVPLAGPTEVRELTGHFNLMTAELEARRREESDLLQNLRHDLRTPLTVIGGFAQALVDGTATGTEETRAAAAIAEEAGRLGRMLEELDMADEATSGSLHPETLEACEIVRETVARFAGAAEAAGVALTGPPGDAPQLLFAADPVAVDRIMANLVENALAAAGRGGSVVVSATGGPPGPEARRRGRAPGRGAAPPGVLLAVTDDGPGFPPGTRDRVFERFYRADPSRSGPGSGLGLSIVRDLARAHGGDAWAEDAEPHGARVLVRLPAIPTFPGSPPHASADAAAAAPRTPAPSPGAVWGEPRGAVSGEPPGAAGSAPTRSPGGP